MSTLLIRESEAERVTDTATMKAFVMRGLGQASLGVKPRPVPGHSDATGSGADAG